MPGVRRLPSGKLQGWYFDSLGRRCYWTSEDPHATVKQVRAIVARLQDEHKQVQLGYRPARTSADRNRELKLTDLVAEYLAWGKAQGGIGGRPWRDHHAAQRRSQLAWWVKRLKLEIVGDLDDSLPRVEAVLRELLKTHSGSTASSYVESLRHLCRWAEVRGYLAGNPLRGMAPIDATPHRQRRPLTTEEIERLLAVAPLHRRRLYQVAMASGLRAAELRALTEADLDIARGGLMLRAEWTKNRKDGFQPLPASLVQALAASRSGHPWARLLHATTNAYRPLDADMKAAGIPKWTPAGVIDFHSLRVTYVTLLVEANANVREVQSLARHSTPVLTMGTYARVRDSGLRVAVERIGSALGDSCAPGVHDTSSADDKTAVKHARTTSSG